MVEPLQTAPPSVPGVPSRRPLWFRRPWFGAGTLGFGVGLILGTIHSPPFRRLLWNASASAPIGLYWVVPGAVLRVGDTAIAEPPMAVRMLAARRHYVPLNVPLVKHVAAIEGARVCAIGADILIDRHVGVHRFATDPHGRPLPWWHGCRSLRAGETLLLNAPPNSFDGRYFGPVGANAIIGRAVPLWLR